MDARMLHCATEERGLGSNISATKWGRKISIDSDIIASHHALHRYLPIFYVRTLKFAITSYFIEIELYFANLDCQEPHSVLATHNCLQTLRAPSCLQIKLFILDLFRDVPISWLGSVGQRKQEAAHSKIFALISRYWHSSLTTELYFTGE